MFTKIFLGVLIIWSFAGPASADTHIEYTLDGNWTYKEGSPGTLSLTDNSCGGITATINVPSGIDPGGLSASKHDLPGFSFHNEGFIQLDYGSLATTITGSAEFGLSIEIEFYGSEPAEKYEIGMAIWEENGLTVFETWFEKDEGFDYYFTVPIPDELLINEGSLGLYSHDNQVSPYFKDAEGNVLYPFSDHDISQIVGMHDFNADNDFEADTDAGGTVVASVNLKEVVYGPGSPTFDGTGIQITGTSSNIMTNAMAGDTVEFTVHTVVMDDAPVEYRFFVRAGYGEPDWGGNKWQIIQPYSPNNTVMHTFDVPGIHFLIGHVIHPCDTWVFGYPQSGIVVEVWPAQ
jgi:hypothetical protein